MRRHKSSVHVLRLMCLAFAVVALSMGVSGHANAGRMQFGADERINKIVDIPVRGPNGESLYLGYKLRSYSFFFPIYMTDDGYVIGFSADITRYIVLDPEKIASLQKQGQLPTPLPVYRLTWDDWFFGYFLWVFLPIPFAIFFLLWLLLFAGNSIGQSGKPLTVAALTIRPNRLKLRASILLLTILVAIPVLARHWLNGAFRDPIEADAATIVAAQATGDEYRWFLVSEKPQRVDRRTVISRLNGRIQRTDYYLHVLPGTPNILIDTEYSDIKAPFYAYLPFASRGSLAEGNYSRAKEAAVGLGYTGFAPFMLSVDYHSASHNLWVAGILTAIFAVPFLLALRLFINALRGLLNPLSTPRLRQLLKKPARAGESIEQLAAEIDGQAARANLKLERKGAFLLPSWLVSYFGAGFLLISIEDVIWIAPQNATSICVFDRYGRFIALHFEDVNDGLRRVCARVPWAAVGPLAEALAFGFKLPGQRAPRNWQRARKELIRRADERRKAMRAQSAAG